MKNLYSDTIVAPATTPGTGAISIVRISGQEAFSITDAVVQLKSGTVSFGGITYEYNKEKGEIYTLLSDITKNNFRENKFLGTIASVTSSEFREGCPGADSFLSTMKFDDMNGTHKTNGLKEIQKV